MFGPSWHSQVSLYEGIPPQWSGEQSNQKGHITIYPDLLGTHLLLV